MDLACASHIPLSVWLEEEDRVLLTAFEVLKEMRKAEQKKYRR